jgi:hypothetical protein
MSRVLHQWFESRVLLAMHLLLQYLAVGRVLCVRRVASVARLELVQTVFVFYSVGVIVSGRIVCCRRC